MAAGAHGIIVEVHYNPAEAQCDGPQALLPETFKELMGQLRQIAAVTKKEFAEAGEPVGTLSLTQSRDAKSSQLAATDV